MKTLTVLAFSSLLLLALGCSSFGGAGVETDDTAHTTTTVASSGANTSHASDAAANGGSSLPASSPYSQPNGATAQQNVNPAPFMTAGGGQGQGTSSGGASLGSGALTSRADGTMSGPNDQPAATTGWGTSATNWTGPAAATGATPATKPAKAPKK